MTRVLVVDDEIDTLNLLGTILEISGYQAFTTLNSVEAITMAEIEHPDCILLDIMMPQLDGFTLCKMMRLHPSTMHLPIIFVTAYSALDLEDRRRDAGADMVLPKPVGMDVLIETIEKATAMRSVPATKPSPPYTPSPTPVPTFTTATPPTTLPVPPVQIAAPSQVNGASAKGPGVVNGMFPQPDGNANNVQANSAQAAADGKSQK